MGRWGSEVCVLGYRFFSGRDFLEIRSSLGFILFFSFFFIVYRCGYLGGKEIFAVVENIEFVSLSFCLGF